VKGERALNAFPVQKPILMTVIVVGVTKINQNEHQTLACVVAHMSTHRKAVAIHVTIFTRTPGYTT
jgi:hypothetical protein